MVRKNFTVLGCGLMLMFLFAGALAHAGPVQFTYRGGHWSHHSHAGWNRYWGGPSIGFYYAPTPVYVVSGYSEPSYYTDSSFWYSNPSFGLSINVGGGRGGGNYGGRDGGQRSGGSSNGRRSRNGGAQRGGGGSHNGGQQSGGHGGSGRNGGQQSDGHGGGGR